MINVKFSNRESDEFTKDLKAGVNQYFETKNISRDGGKIMIFKSIFMLLLYLIPLGFLVSGQVTQVIPMFILYLLSGLGMSGIGMSIMHDALHGSFSKNRVLNRWMGYSINLIGASAAVWKVQHNVLHHTFTNVHELDDDLNTSSIIRLSPDRDHHNIHKFQHIYAWFLYGFMTLIWLTTRDYVRGAQYKQKGFFNKKGEFGTTLVKATLFKLLYFGVTLVLPMIMIPLPWWIILLAFFSMLFATGVILSVVFQTAHVMPDNDFPKPDKDGIIGGSWALHQLATTSNYAPKSRIFSWFIGGLNYQIEHHLMPNISHIHYKELSKVVRATAEKHGFPYYSRPTFVAALWAHMKMLKSLGAKSLEVSRI